MLLAFAVTYFCDTGVVVILNSTSITQPVVVHNLTLVGGGFHSPMPHTLQPGIVTSFEVHGSPTSGVQCKWATLTSHTEVFCDMKVLITDNGKVNYVANGYCRHGILMQIKNQLIWLVSRI
jgi:hypothetical protein